MNTRVEDSVSEQHSQTGDSLPQEVPSAFCGYGAEVTERYLKAMMSQVAGVKRGSDEECVHRMRVASRRLRAALLLFSRCFGKRVASCWRDDVRKVTKALGEARDTDVQILFLGSLEEEFREIKLRRAVEYFMEHLRERRARLQGPVVEAVDRLGDDRAIIDMRRECQRIAAISARRGIAGGGKTNYARFDHDAYRQASKIILARLERLLWLEPHVHRVDDVKEHHMLRIELKRLRYTLEIFNEAYGGSFSDHLNLFKRMQDLLGLMHDCDVWLVDIPALVLARQGKRSFRKRTMPGLEAFWERIRDLRLSYYNEFVDLWGSASNERRFERLIEICAKAIYDELRRSTNRPVRVALISDIHSNVSALNAAIADARSKGTEMFVCCGDAIWNGAHPEEVMRRLAEIDAFCIAGNNEHRIVAELRDGRGEEGQGDMKRHSNGFELERLSTKSLRCINSLPFMLVLELDKRRIAVFHGSPDSIEEYIRPGTPRFRYERIVKDLQCDYAVFGHSHHQFKKKVGDAMFVNPGSVGWPYDERQGAAYAILTPATGDLQFHRPTYDMAPEIRGMLRSGFDEDVVHGLIHARPPTHEGTHYDVEKDAQFMRKRIEEFATKENMDLKHAVYVKELCLRLFDLLIPTHHMGSRERAYLEFAAMLHDVGFSRGIKAHHKSSFWMILQERTLPLDLRDRLIVAGVARYHRKRHPKKVDDGFRQLSAPDRSLVEKLSAIIRVADSLDASHGSFITIRSLKTRHGVITLDCDAHGSADYELAAFNEKKGLFMEAFHKDIVVKVRPVQEQRF